MVQELIARQMQGNTPVFPGFPHMSMYGATTLPQMPPITNHLKPERSEPQTEESQTNGMYK